MKRSITLIVPAENRARYLYERFADELRLWTASPVAIVGEESGFDAGNGFLIVHGLDGLRSLFLRSTETEALPSRTVTLHAGPETHEEGLLRCNLAGSISPAPYLHWAEGRWPEGGRSDMYGLRSVARTLGLDTDPRFKHSRYCLLGNRETLPLPGLLALYLEAYAAVLDGPSWDPGT